MPYVSDVGNRRNYVKQVHKKADPNGNGLLFNSFNSAETNYSDSCSQPAAWHNPCGEKRSCNPKDLPFVSIIVLNYNGKRHLDECLNSLKEINYPREKLEVLLVDNGSTDGSVDYVRANYPWVRIIKLKRNYGFAMGNNIASNFARGSYLVFLNNDTVVDKNWLIHLIRPVLESGKELIVSSKMLRYDDRQTIAYNGGRLLAWGFVLPDDCYRHDYEDERRLIPTFYADGASLLISKNLFKELGGFDPEYMAYAEDYDLSWRVLLKGLDIYACPNSRYYHKVGGTWGSGSMKYGYHLWRNQLTNIIKYAEATNLIKMLLLSIPYSICAILIFLVEGRRKLAPGILMAYVEVFRRLPKIFQLRRKYQANRVVRDSDLRKRKLMLGIRESIRASVEFLRRRWAYKRLACYTAQSHT